MVDDKDILSQQDIRVPTLLMIFVTANRTSEVNLCMMNGDVAKPWWSLLDFIKQAVQKLLSWPHPSAEVLSQSVSQSVSEEAEQLVHPHLQIYGVLEAFLHEPTGLSALPGNAETKLSRLVLAGSPCAAAANLTASGFVCIFVNKRLMQLQC